MNLTFDFQISTSLWQPSHMTADFLKIYNKNYNNELTSPGKFRAKSSRQSRTSLDGNRAATIKATLKASPQASVNNDLELRENDCEQNLQPVDKAMTFTFKGIARNLCLNNSATAAYKDLINKGDPVDIAHTFNGKISNPYKTRIHHIAGHVARTEIKDDVAKKQLSLSPPVPLPKRPRIDNDKLPPSRVEPYYALGEEEMDLLVDELIRGMKNLKLEDTKPVAKKQSPTSVFEIMFAFKDLGL